MFRRYVYNVRTRSSIIQKIERSEKKMETMARMWDIGDAELKFEH